MLLHRSIQVVEPQLAIAAFVLVGIAVLLQGGLHRDGAQQAGAVVQGDLDVGLAAQLWQQGFQRRDPGRIGMDGRA